MFGSSSSKPEPKRKMGLFTECFVGERTFEEHIYPTTQAIPLWISSDSMDTILGITMINGINGSLLPKCTKPQSPEQKKHFNKPLWITEIGCAHDDRKASWLADFLNYYESEPALELFIWYHEDKRNSGEQNWRLDSDSSSLRVFQAWATSAQ